jgi:hypothetical protein
MRTGEDGRACITLAARKHVLLIRTMGRNCLRQRQFLFDDQDNPWVLFTRHHNTDAFMLLLGITRSM